MGVPLFKVKDVIKAAKNIKPVHGRLEKIGSLKNNASVILDYAHTPDALKTVLSNVKEQFPLAKIRLIFGCGGERDKKKRSVMGKIADKYCDVIILTDDNPRKENPEKIRKEIIKHLKGSNYFDIGNRSKAIKEAIQELR